MDRRKFLIGAGSLAAGGAAAMGSGAFTSVEADRSVDVEIAGDESAYLSISSVDGSPNSDYVTASNEVELDFSSTNSNNLGDGFNSDSVTRINDLLEIANQGTQEVNFWVNISKLGAGSDFVTIEASNNSTDSNNFNDTTSASDELAYDGGNAGDVKEVALSTGESIYLHLVVDTESQTPNSFDGTATFVAESGGEP